MPEIYVSCYSIVWMYNGIFLCVLDLMSFWNIGLFLSFVCDIFFCCIIHIWYSFVWYDLELESIVAVCYCVCDKLFLASQKLGGNKLYTILCTCQYIYCKLYSFSLFFLLWYKMKIFWLWWLFLTFFSFFFSLMRSDISWLWSFWLGLVGRLSEM